MKSTTYEQIALNWQPDSKDNQRFNIIITVTLAVVFLLAILVSFIDVPEKPRQQAKIPDRVAQFIKKKPKPKVVVPPKPKLEPKPIPKPKPKVERVKDKPKKPLTEKEKTARAKAEKSGILALAEEFADLIDSSAVDAAVATKVISGDKGKARTAGMNADKIIASASKGSGGVSSNGIATGVGSTQLSAQEMAAVQQSLFSEDIELTEEGKVKGPRGDNVRSEEEVTVVFDQNKGRLQSLYNRERRKKPSLQGKIVFEITISPEGNVVNVHIVSSELNDPTLEAKLISRIKNFKFGSKNVEAVTVTFPIEFLPS